MAKPITELQEMLAVTFRDANLLKQALVHRSYINEHPTFALGHNERLEFLGDAVLELVVTEHLYKAFPDKPEGILTNWRAGLVNADMLASIADEILLNDFLLLSRGEAQDRNGKARRYILANAMEALIGALYLDQGYEAAKKFITTCVLTKLRDIVDGTKVLDPKSLFQEKSQEQLGVTPAYRVTDEVGPDHAKQFTVAVYIGSELVATGAGSSKQEAQVNAAQAALVAKGWQP